MSPVPPPVSAPGTFFPDVDELLIDLAVLASQSIPGNDGAGATLVQDGVTRFRSSNTYARGVDRIQYRIGDGPCISAVDSATTVVSGTMGTGEHRWPQFCAETAGMGVASVLSLPLTLTDRSLGSINVYSATAHAFPAAAVGAGEVFAVTAASSLATACLLVAMADAAVFTGYGLRDRAVVETATGLLAGRHQLSVPAAQRRLAELAVSTGATLLAAATELISATQHEQS